MKYSQHFNHVFTARISPFIHGIFFIEISRFWVHGILTVIGSRHIHRVFRCDVLTAFSPTISRKLSRLYHSLIFTASCDFFVKYLVKVTKNFTDTFMTLSRPLSPVVSPSVYFKVQIRFGSCRNKQNNVERFLRN